MGDNPTCRSCGIAGQCGKGCPAAVTAAGERIGAVDDEPSPTPLGQLIRAGTGECTGMALACLVAGDRHHHLATEIRPALAARQIVLCDRYLPSSLVLQRMDGISGTSSPSSTRAPTSPAWPSSSTAAPR